MNANQFVPTAIAIGLLCMALLALPAQAQSYEGYTCEGLWEHVHAGGDVIFDETRAWFENTCVKEDEPEEADDEADAPIVQERHPRPPVVTCPALPASVVVFGYVEGTQCQMVGEAGVGNSEAIKRGFINAVDIWSYVNGGIEVCFRNVGSLVFLDAAYAPRMLMELASFQRDGMTCGAINGAGTVVLVRSGAPSAPVAPSPPVEPTLPTIDSVPLYDCQIKLTETLFLRATPGGDIIGLVWLYSEVPVFESSGDWYKVEFEGTIGYISRDYHRVLSGCA